MIHCRLRLAHGGSTSERISQTWPGSQFHVGSTQVVTQVLRYMASLMHLNLPWLQSFTWSAQAVHWRQNFSHMLKNEGSSFEEAHYSKARAHSSAASCKIDQACPCHTQDGHQDNIFMDGFSSDSHVDQNTLIPMEGLCAKQSITNPRPHDTCSLEICSRHIQSSGLRLSWSNYSST